MNILGMIRRLDTAEENISKLEHITAEIIQNEKHRKENHEPWDNLGCFQMWENKNI
jgi:hypothetical protein